MSCWPCSLQQETCSSTELVHSHQWGYSQVTRSLAEADGSVPAIKGSCPTHFCPCVSKTAAFDSMCLCAPELLPKGSKTHPPAAAFLEATQIRTKCLFSHQAAESCNL